MNDVKLGTRFAREQCGALDGFQFASMGRDSRKARMLPRS